MSYNQTVKQFILDEFLPDVPADQLAEDLDLVEGGVIDSLGLLKVIAWLESHYDIAIDVGDMVPENFASVGAIAAFLERHADKPAASAA
ncbi:acyl carrier protein [Marinivivus vitaminiproducens]|uniref:acyl carrier protein n=1 Tax=Marinivivus vitaminiproducens TaxID=3035935 RepID=UPI002798C3AD|nr:phosphopantetheine-binding protein [Geminicoccaceae bacterium SCSIO 64248]